MACFDVFLSMSSDTNLERSGTNRSPKLISRRRALLQDAVRRKAARIEVSYDGRYGYPAELFIDYDERMADEETRFVMRGFTIR